MFKKSDFSIEKEIANGRYGKIYLALMNDNNNEVVIKKVDLLSIPKEDKKLIENEVYIHKSVHSPYIVEFIGSYILNAEQFIVIEYCKSGDLKSHIDLKLKEFSKFSEKTIITWMSHMLKGLSIIHANYIIHRDIKPENMLLQLSSPHSLCKIADFGLSWKLSSITDKVNTITGTPIYMAPEIVSQIPYSFSVDIWSLGCILYELCELKSPFYSPTLSQTLDNIKNKKIPDISKDYSKELRQLLYLLLDRDYNKRMKAENILKLPLFTKYIKLKQATAKPKYASSNKTTILKERSLSPKHTKPIGLSLNYSKHPQHSARPFSSNSPSHCPMTEIRTIKSKRHVKNSPITTRKLPIKFAYLSSGTSNSSLLDLRSNTQDSLNRTRPEGSKKSSTRKNNRGTYLNNKTLLSNTPANIALRGSTNNKQPRIQERYKSNHTRYSLNYNGIKNNWPNTASNNSNCGFINKKVTKVKLNLKKK